MISGKAVDNLNDWVSKVRGEINERRRSGAVVSVFENRLEWPIITAPFVQSKYEVRRDPSDGKIRP